MNRVRILLADDHPAVLDRVVQLLSPEYEIVGAVRDGQSVVDVAISTRPDLLILDISMPIMNGIEAASRITQAGVRMGIIFLTVHEEPDYVPATQDAGGLGYVLKASMTKDLREAIHSVLQGKQFISPSLDRLSAESKRRYSST